MLEEEAVVVEVVAAVVVVVLDEDVEVTVEVVLVDTTRFDCVEGYLTIAAVAPALLAV